MASSGMEDLSQLDNLDETAILEALRTRYAKDLIYTNCGNILIAVNPYKTLPIFDTEHHDSYDWKKFEASAPPHIFNVAARAYQQMRETTTDQVILVSGESGAGKTESTKLMVKHFVHMCPHETSDDDNLHEKVVKVNPLLEAFGNAQTIMNENSSRFAKFLELSFAGNGQVLGVVVRDYMLEKSRVVNYSYDEGNFHIFYSLFAGASKEQLKEIELTEAKDYKIMTKGSPELLTKTAEYDRMYSEQMSVLRQIGYNEEDISILHYMLGAIVHLTEIRFRESEKQNEPLEIVNPDRVMSAAKLLNVKPLELSIALLKTKTDYGGEEIHVLKSMSQASDGRDALAKDIYARLFGWVIRRINEDLNPSRQTGDVSARIGVLDIAGFENLHVNSFEQLCINFVNERLQNFMNDSVFKTEKDIYQEEGISFKDVDFKNNMDIIDVFVQKRIGILPLLDEETKFQQGSDEKFVQKITNNHSDSGIVVMSSTNDSVFGINHFAGKVLYSCQGFLEKNKDTLNDDLFDCMKDSENPFIQDLFTVAKGPTGTISETQFNLRQSHRFHGTKKNRAPKSDDAKKLIKELGRSMKRYGGMTGIADSFAPKRQRTVLSYFTTSMDRLLQKMKNAEAHFVRCIKPNNQKQKETFNGTRVKEQLLYNGITEIAKIRKQGYPVRKKHVEFYKRYCILHPGYTRKTPDNVSQSVRTLVDKLLPNYLQTEYKIGKYRIFLKEPAYMFLENYLYIREKSAKKCVVKTLRKVKEIREKQRQEEERRQEEEEKKRHEKALKLTEELERERKDSKDTLGSSLRVTGTSSKLGATADSSMFGSTIGSTIGSTHGSSTSESSTSGSVSIPFSSLKATMKPDGSHKPIETPTGESLSFIKPDIDKPPSYEKARSSVKGKAPAPPSRHPPSRKKATDDVEQKENENKKESKEFWDIFAHIPREKKSKDVHERGSLRFIKVITYGLLFLILFASLVFQKISLMLLVNKQNRNFTEKYPHIEKKDLDHIKKLEDCYNSARYLLLVLAICIPYILNVLLSILKVLFGNLPFPNKSTLCMIVFMESAHTVGLSFLVFKYLGEMHSARGLMVMMATCILPSILKPFFAKDDSNGSSVNRCSKFCKKVTVFFADLIAIVAQISAIPVVLNLGFLFNSDDPTSDWETIVEVVFCLLLCSFSWWENFMDDRAFGTSEGRLQQFILQIKFDLQEGRPVITFVTSFFKIGLTIMMAFFLKDGLDLNVSDAANLFSENLYENYLPSKQYEHYNYIKDFTSIICITICSYVAYYIAYTICKLRMQVVSFSVACLLSTPVAVMIVMLDCNYGVLFPFTKEELECFSEKSYDKNHWYHFLIGLLWLISAYWIARYIWFPNQERLAKVDRLFVNPLYCSMLLEQHLLMNRRRHTKKIRTEFRNEKPFYRLSKDNSRHQAETDRSKMKKIPPMIYACATMWHENRLEMVQLLKSLYRVDFDQFVRKQAVEMFRAEHQDTPFDPEEFEYYEFQAHILFDDAFEFDDDEERVPNSFVKLFMEVMQEAANAIHHKQIKLAPPMKIPSPYGAQLVFEMPGENMMYVHLKDKNKIRHRKRWSQVMYMYYLLGYRIVRECQERVLQALQDNKFGDLASWGDQLDAAIGRVGKGQIFDFLDDEVLYRAENTFILALDGDVDFTPKAVRLLVDRMQKNELLGASCGRIHPIGKGPMVWYQKFEYAVAHWLQKSTEHVLGCVLCSPGCFSLFRGSALMDDNIMRKYTIKPTEASHHLMYDQGEDRWLCTLLLQQGYRVDYAAASDAYTYAPEGFAEFFNQRRRWMPSTIANIMDLLTDAKNTVSINNNISWLYMFYQGALMVSTLIGPATVIMMIAGAYLTVFHVNLVTSYAIALTPAVGYTILCFFVKTKYQIMVAEIFSALYAFIMMIVLVGCIITAVQESPFHPSVIFLCAMVFIFLFAALIHPWEFSCIIHGSLYFLCVPSGFLLLVIYSLVNMNSISWGTREVPKKKTKAEIEEEEKKKKEKEEKKKQGWFSRFMPKFQLQDLKGLMEITKKEDKTVLLLEQMNKNMERLLGSKDKDGVLTDVVVEKDKSSDIEKTKKRVSFATATVVEVERKCTEEEEYIYQKEKKKRNDLINPKWLEIAEFKPGSVLQMNEEETQFWKKFIKKYLEPLEANKEEQKKIKKELAELRNNVTAGFAFINLIWVAINFMFQLRKPAVITFPVREGADDVNEENIKIDALGLMFVIFFVVILLIQFFGMIIHRWGTFMHLIAITEIPNPCKKNMEDRQKKTKNEREAKDIIRLCEEIAGEPMPDYPSDEEEEKTRDEIREEALKEKINNFATQGVAENLRMSQRNPNIGKSLRDTRIMGDSEPIGRIGKTFRNDNFKREANNLIAQTRREVLTDGGFTPNNLRQRGNRTKKEDRTRIITEHSRTFGVKGGALLDLMEKIHERDLETRVAGMERTDRRGNLAQTFRRTDSIEDEDDEPIYDEIPGGTLSRAFMKKIQKLSKTGVRPSDTNGGLHFSDIEMHSVSHRT